MDLGYICNEIERMRTQTARQRKEILQLQRAGLSTAAAGTLLERMLAKVDALCAERDKLKAQLPPPPLRKVLGGRKW